MQIDPVPLLVAQSANATARWDRAAILVGLLVAVVLVRELVVLIVRGRREHAEREHAAQSVERDEENS